MADDYNRHSEIWAEICTKIRSKFYKIDTDAELEAILNNLSKNNFIDFIVSVIDDKIAEHETDISKLIVMKNKILTYKN